MFGTSRGKINLILYEAALKNDKIKVHFNHKLTDIDLNMLQLTFERYEKDGKTPVKVQLSTTARLIAADGVNSAVRNVITQKDTSLKAKVTPWTFEFRVLFAPAGKMSDKLDTKVHYICSGMYVATIDNNNQQQWTGVMSVHDFESKERADLLALKKVVN